MTEDMHGCINIYFNSENMFTFCLNLIERYWQVKNYSFSNIISYDKDDSKNIQLYMQVSSIQNQKKKKVTKTQKYLMTIKNEVITAISLLNLIQELCMMIVSQHSSLHLGFWEGTINVGSSSHYLWSCSSRPSRE